MSKKLKNQDVGSTQLQDILTREFVQIDMLLKRFNIFEATDMKRREVKHTKFLAHLLNPNEPHGLGIRFLENFILNLNSETIHKKINLLGLDLLNTIVMSEEGLKLSDKKGKQIDLLLIIPGANSTEKNTLIAIEAKVDSKESVNQLSTYRSLIESKYDAEFEKHYFFLTMRGDDPSDSEWSSVMFSNVVTPTVRTLINFHRETISDYLISIIEDYVEVIDSDQIKESDVDKLAEQISDGVYAVIKNLNSNAPIKSPERIIQNRYYAAIDFLKNYDNDCRKIIPKEFELIFKSSPQLRFKHETSSRQYLRASFLSFEGERFIKQICEHANVKWIESLRNLAFEFVLIRDSEDAKLVNISLKLTLGPTSDSFTGRAKLVEHLKGKIYAYLYKNKEKPDASYVKNVSPCYTTLIGSRELAMYARKSLSPQQVIEYINNMLHDNFLVDLAKIIDDELVEFHKDYLSS